MSNLSRLSPIADIKTLFGPAAVGIGFSLTVEDRLGIERLLGHSAMMHASNPPLLRGLLRHKLRISRAATEPAPAELVVAGRQVTYMVSGEGARSGLLSMSPAPHPGHILVASLLGATLVGMRKLQKVPLLRDDGGTVTLVVLDVTQPPDHAA